MALPPGSKLGHFEILSPLGAGGMGEVYRALDSTLKREVAIKLLPEAFARDQERIARFKREAQLLAALNHPNIATIHGLHNDGQQYFLVMELVAGETLAEMIQQCRDRQGAGVGFGKFNGKDQKQPPLADARSTVSALPIEDALNITTQICEALEHAHEHGVIHRDLKPANVKVTPEGKVKVLDFGLAKAFAADGGSAEASPNPGVTYNSQSPTLSASPTIPGVILGTAAYMSPEQARGKPVDKRTDIWALGCILYELLTGRQLFSGESVADILGAVVHKDPDWTLLPEATPPAIRALLRRCLKKEAKHRYHDAADIRITFEDMGAAAAATHASAPSPRRWLLYSAAACVIVAALTGIAVWQLRPAPVAPARPVERLASALPPNTALIPSTQNALALSPDGRRLAYVASGSAGGQLYLRAMDSLEAVPLAGTEGAYAPFFSPDGEWIGFASGTSLKKISASGGAAVTLCPLSGTFSGATWGPDNTIIFASSNNSRLIRVSAAGGQPEPFTALQPGEISHRWPQFLPDGKTVMFTIGTGASYDGAQIAVQQLDSEERTILVRGGTYGRYVPTGHLVYYRAGTIMAVPFDSVALELKGSASPVVEGVAGFAISGIAQFAFSHLGSLTYLPGDPQSDTQTMVWVNRQGVATPLPAPPRAYRAPRVSPDGSKISVGIGSDIWIYDIQRDTLTRLTFERNNATYSATWTQDSTRVIFPSDRAGSLNLFWKPVDGSGPEEQLTSSRNVQRGGFPSPDGRLLLFTDTDPKTGSDTWVLPMEGDRKPRVFLQTPFNESSGQFSPDGSWVAYSSNESGRLEVYVRPFPGPGGKWQISTEGGMELAWNPKGKELFYRTGNRKEKMMVVEYETQPTFSAGKPRLLFEGNYVANAANSAGAFYSVSPDGQRFLMTKTPDQQQAALTQINVVLNWFEELKQKVPVK